MCQAELINQEVRSLRFLIVCPAPPTDADLDKHLRTSENKPALKSSFHPPQTIGDLCLLCGRVFYSADRGNNSQEILPAGK